MLPEDILNKIMLFNSHPVADIIKASTSFEFMKFRGKMYDDIGEDDMEIEVLSFDNGCNDAYNGETYMFNDFCLFYDSRIDSSNISSCAES